MKYNIHDVKRLLIFLVVAGFWLTNNVRALAERTVTTLNDGWEFTKGIPDASTKWQQVRVPHDWAIYGPFDRDNDLQKVAVEQNGEKEETVKTGRTGGLPFIGQGTYRTTFEVPDTADRNITLVFDGAISNAYVKGAGKFEATAKGLKPAVVTIPVK